MSASDHAPAAPGRTRHPGCGRRLAVDRRRPGHARHHRRVRGHGRLRLAAAGRLGRGRPRPGAGGAPALGRHLRRRAGSHRPGGHLALGRRAVRRPGAAPTGLVRVRGAVRRARVVGQPAEPGPAGHPPDPGAGPAGQRRHPRPDPLVPAGGGRRPGRRGRARPAVLAAPGLLRRGHVGQPDPDGGGPGPRLPGLPAGRHRADRQPGGAVWLQPALQLRRWAVRAGRPDAVPAHRVLPGAGLGAVPVPAARHPPGGPRAGLRDHLRGGAGARPAGPGGRRQPAGRAAPRPPRGRGDRPPRWPSCCPRRPRRSETRRRPATGRPRSWR